MQKRLASGIGVWFEKDIENALMSLDTANEEIYSLIQTPEMKIYRHGYSAAITAMATMFGCNYRSYPENQHFISSSNRRNDESI